MPCPNQAERLRVIAEAERIFASGAHYFWGCQSSGIFRQTAVHMLPNRWGATDEEKCVFAAQYGSRGVCAGRPDHADVRRRRRWNQQTAPPAEVDRAAWLWPRYFTDPDTVHPGPPGLVYGEDCQGKEHYDCAGYVRHCYATGTGRAPGAMRTNATLVWTRGQGPLSAVDLYPADIAYGAGGNHVGILSGNSAYGAANAGVSYHAFAARLGVVRVPLAQCGWIAEVRRWTHW